MVKCHLCNGVRVADLVRTATSTDPGTKRPVCDFHAKEIKKDLVKGLRWDGSPVPEGWEIQTDRGDSPLCPLCGTWMFMGVVGTDLDGTYSEQWFCRGRDCRGKRMIIKRRG
jgi:hypothetical protein